MAKNIFVLRIMAFESALANRQNPEQDTSHRQSRC